MRVWAQAPPAFSGSYRLWWQAEYWRTVVKAQENAYGMGENPLARMSHKGGGERRKAARSAGGASSTSGNHRTGLLLRICSPSSPRMYRFFVRARHSRPQIGRRTQIRLATPFLSAAKS